MPAILKIIIVFASILFVARMRVQLGLALALGGLVLALWSGLGFGRTLSALGSTLTGAELWMLLLITVLIVEIGHFMTEERNARDLVAAVRKWGGRHGRATTMMALPAVIGLVPMPAGALFSAPFVEQAAGRNEGAVEWKSAVNYWFRHVWEYWWPLYPGVIVAMSVFDMIETWQFMLAQIWYSVVAGAAGYFFLVRPRMASLVDNEGSRVSGGGHGRTLLLVAPLLIVITSVLIFPFLFSGLMPGMAPQIRKMSAILAGLVVALLVIAVGTRQRSGMFRKVFEKKSRNVLMTLTGVLIFKAMLSESGLLPLAGRDLVESGIPLAFAVALLPFLAGIVTGIALGFTGSSFPMVVGLISAKGSGLYPLSTLVLAFGFGYAGMLLSPVHLCLLVTKDYFSAGMPGIYLRILPCLAPVLAYSLAAFFILRAFSL